MEKDLIFFGEQGLTSTSANFVANIAKERYASIVQALESIVFYTTTIKLLGTNETTVLKEGIMSVATVESDLKKVAKLERLLKQRKDSSRNVRMVIMSTTLLLCLRDLKERATLPLMMLLLPLTSSRGTGTITLRRIVLLLVSISIQMVHLL